MKKLFLPGIEPPQPGNTRADMEGAEEKPVAPDQETVAPDQETKEWPSTAELLAALAHCDVPPVTRKGTLKQERILDAENGLPPLIVAGMGLGPSLPPELAARLEISDVIAAGAKLLDRLPELTAEKIPLRSPIRETLDVLLERRRNGKRVTLLAGGDPLFFGIGAQLAPLLPPEALHILPGISSLQEACARARLPLHDVECVSLHGRDDFTPLARAALTGRSICILTDADRSPAEIARFLTERGADHYVAHIFECLNSTQERVRVCSLEETAQLAFDPVCTMLLIPDAPSRRPFLGLPDPPGESGMFTKRPIRAAALAALRIEPYHTVWDLGAGSGLIALEACALTYRGSVFAVERDPERAARIREQRRCFGAANLEIILGNAPECLEYLPDPDAVFLGGGLGDPQNADRLLHLVHTRLKTGGRLVISCVLLGSLERCRAFLKKNAPHAELFCIQASEAVPLANDLRLAADNPVFLAGCVKAD